MAQQDTKTRVAVVGAGAFGRNHLRVYSELEQSGAPVTLAAVVDASPEIRANAAEVYFVPAFESVEALLAAGIPLDAASVCVPTIHHAAAAAPLLEAGIDVLIEKPFAATTQEADALMALAQKHDRLIQVGHLERFNPAVAAARAHLNRPMFFESHRLSIFTARSLDVDVVLDLMIHDLDIVLSFVASPVREVRAVGLAVLSPTVDIANVRLEFENGCIANFTASRVSTEQVRKLRLFQPHQYLSLDFARQELLTISVDPAILTKLSSLSSTSSLSSRPEAALLAAAAERPAALSASPIKFGASLHESHHPSPGLTLTKSEIPRAEPLRLELEDFLNAVRTRTQPRVPAEAGRAALSLALEINHQIAAHAHRAGLA